MKRILHSYLWMVVALLLAGCDQTTPTAPQANNNATPANVTVNANLQQPPQQQPQPPTNSNAAPTPAGEPSGPDIVPQALLRGTYAISEVQHDGLVEMISPDNTTEITFLPPASFTRQSKKGGKIDHTDSGEYNVFGTSTLILKIMMSKQKIQVQPVVKRHPFSMSADGNEFKLTSEKGGVAVFRRIRQAAETP